MRTRLAVAGDVRPGLLRDRDDGLGRAALRPGAVRHGGLPGLAAAGRPDDRGRPGQPEDGAGAAPDLRPDAQPQVGALDGRLRLQRRDVQQLRDRPGRRPRRAGRHLPARLPAAAGDADGRDHQAARADPGRAARRQPRAHRTRVRGGRADRQAHRADEGPAAGERARQAPAGEPQAGRRSRRGDDRRATRHVRRARHR